MNKKDLEGQAVWDIRRKTRKQYSTEEKIRIGLSGLRGKGSIASLCQRKGASPRGVRVISMTEHTPEGGSQLSAAVQQMASSLCHSKIA